MNYVKTAVTLLIISGAAFSQTSISGNLGGMVLDSTGNPFVVDKDIVVPKGKSVTIKEGCVLLFKPFSGMVISGNCSVNGTAEHPVVFTSINDATYNKASAQASNAFDWNGIAVDKESADVSFKYVNVRFSIYGIKSQNPNIMISQGVFKQNGQFHFTVNNKIEAVLEDQPFSYNENNQTQPAPAASPSAPSHKLKIVRCGLLGVGGAGAIVGTILSINAAQKYGHWKDIEKQTNPLPPPGEYDKRKSAYNSAFTGALVTDIIAGLALAGFGITFAF
jgi:hypothetical protein